jgi:hypothetical protein
VTFGQWAAIAIVLAGCANARPSGAQGGVSGLRQDGGTPRRGEAPPLGIAVHGDCFRVQRQSSGAERDDLTVTIPDVTSSAPNKRFVRIKIWSPLSAGFAPFREDQELLLSSTPRTVVVKLSAPKGVQAFEVVLKIETNEAVLTKEIRRVCPS